jgi:hypothetical protein
MKISNALYQTPVVRFDALAQVVIVEHRNPETGELSYQLPSEQTVREQDQAALAGTGGGEKLSEQRADDASAAKPEEGAATGGPASPSGNRVSIVV